MSPHTAAAAHNENAGIAAGVLLAEDDAGIAEPLARALIREGYDCQVVGDGLSALDAAADPRFELLILDLGLPELDGLEVCRRVRETRPGLAVLMLTARTDEVDFVVGLDAGADDYVGKPFRLAELLARVRALLRRRRPVETTLDGGPISLDARARRVLVDGEDLVLANREFDLLQFLMERAGQVVGREEILTEVWGSAADLRSSKTLDMHISWLRRKIGDDQYERPRHIVTVRGVGFRFDP